MKNLTQINLAPNGGYKGLGDGPLANPSGDGVDTFASFLSSVVGLITIIGIIWFMFILITGAIGIISSGGDKGALEGAKKKIATGLIGLVVLVVAMFILSLIGSLLGFGGITNLRYMFSLLQ